MGVSERNYCAHCGKSILPENAENGNYVDLRLTKLFCEECGRTTFIRRQDGV